MGGSIVEGVAHDGLALPFAAAMPQSTRTLAADVLLGKVELCATVAIGLAPWHTIVGIEVEPLCTVGVDHGRGGKALEPVHHKDGGSIRSMEYCRQFFRIETLAALVHRCHLEAVEQVGLQFQSACRAVDAYAVVIVLLSCRCVEDVGIRASCGFTVVGLRLPPDGERVAPVEFCTELLWSERCHHIVGMVRLGIEAQDGFVETACQGKAEVGVVAQPHVGEILVGECLDDGRRHDGATGFGIVAVVEVADVPLAARLGEVGVEPLEQHLGKVFGEVAGKSCGQQSASSVGGADGQRTVHGAKIWLCTGIAMHGK